MKKRSLILFWPLWLAPLAALLVAELSGPTYTDAPNQSAMIIRGFGLIFWFFIALPGCLFTLLSVKPKEKIEWVGAACAAVASVFVFFVISSSMK